MFVKTLFFLGQYVRLYTNQTINNSSGIFLNKVDKV
jgi:hypothetical protein